MSGATDWRVEASAEYRAKRTDLQNKVVAATKAEQRAVGRRVEFEKQLTDLDAGARAFELDIDQTAESATAVAECRPAAEGSVREIILSALETAYPEGLRAKRLKAVIEKKLGREVHYKTPGMTLYRMAETGNVRREGFDWFLAKPPSSAPEQDEPHVVHPDEVVQLQPDLDWHRDQFMEGRNTGAKTKGQVEGEALSLARYHLATLT